jgi:hypothetical protein
VAQLSLFAGLVLPWLGGTMWLVFFESRLGPLNPPNRLRQAGYGFFLGYVILLIAVLTTHRMTGAVSWPMLMSLLGLFAVSGTLAAFFGRAGKSISPTSPESPQSISIKILTAVILAWTLVHLALFAVDVFTQPVYPWDAWLAWVYRAKAWFLAGDISTVIAPPDWIAATSAGFYTIDAWMYPLFPSIIPYWAALSLGFWSETLVNLPVLLAALALGMALYGQCREFGLSISTSVICCYLLYSIPLLGTHISLAGYADIWMAGFTGLGFIAVIRAIITRAVTPEERYGLQMAIGLLLLALGVLVKNEGAVWFLAALALLILTTCRAYVPIMIVVAMTVLVLLGFALGITFVELPLLGTLGVVDGRLFIPFIGNFALEVHNIWHVYWENFYTMGSWNLLWVLLLTSLVISTNPTANLLTRRVSRISFAFLGIFLATQFFIFGLTDQGLWADTYTAINRLPLHFTPALLFVAFVVLNSQEARLFAGSRHFIRREPFTMVGEQGQFGRTILLSVIAGMLVLAGLIFFLSRDLPDEEAIAFIQPAADFNFAFGSGHPEEDHMVVDGFDNGYALLSSGPVSIEASSQPVLGYSWVPSGTPGEAAFFWRQKGDEANVIRTEITTTGKQMMNLATEAGWQGEIIEFGFLVAGEKGQPIEIGPVSLGPDTLEGRLRLMWQAWTTFELRSQQSINFLQGGDHRQVVPLPLLLIAWLFTTMLLLKLSHKRSSLLVPGCLLLLASWMVLDIRWTNNQYKQVRPVLQSGWQTDEKQRLSSDLDGEIYQYVQRLESKVLDESPGRILILGDESAIDYFLLRAKYHLLPHSVHVMGRLPPELSPQTLNFVIYFGQPGGISNVAGWNSAWRHYLREVERNKWGVVYKVSP